MESYGSGVNPGSFLAGGYVKVSREKLHREAQATGFRPEILEKVIQLLNLLEAFQGHPFIEGRLALKGGLLSISSILMCRGYQLISI
jgi:hypothetical protein